jgi:hypothetical protein
MSDGQHAWSVADPFDLPDWLGAEPLRWSTTSYESTTHIEGELTGESGQAHPLDLLCADVAYPAAALDESLRHDTHQAWHFGEVLLLEREGRHALAIPATRWDADIVCEALRRFAKAIGVAPSHLSVVLRL